MYSLFKFLHLAAVIVWIGGMIALSVLNARLAREEDGVGLRVLSRQSAFFGRAVMGPAAMTTLVAGFALVGLTGGGFPLWVVWGLAGVFGSIALGAVFARRAAQEMAELSATVRPGDARLEAVRRRLALLTMINIALLLSTVWAMVFKPTL